MVHVRSVCSLTTARSATALVLATSVASTAIGVVVETQDREGWFAAAGPVTTIGFTGFPPGTVITDQYTGLGVLFTDGDDWVGCCSYEVWPNDGAGLSSYGNISLVFSEPQRWIAADFLAGELAFELFFEGSIIY